MTMRSLAVAAASSAALALGACQRPSTPGGIQGKVVSSTGKPVAGARVMLDGPHGPTTTSNAKGEFKLSHVAAGKHSLFALVALGTHHAGMSSIQVTGSGITHASVTLDNTCSPDGGGGDPGSSDPCDWPPPPLPDQLQIAQLTLEAPQEGSIDPWGMWIYGESPNLVNGAGVAVDVYVPGDFTSTTGGSFSGHVTNDLANGSESVHIGLQVEDDNGYYYLLADGDVTLDVEPVAGEPEERHYVIHGSNLVFDYLECTGTLYPDRNADVTSMDGMGEADLFLPPAPPTSNVDVASFVPDDDGVWFGIEAETTSGLPSNLLVSATDSQDGVAVSFDIPLAALTLPGTSQIDGNTATGSALLYRDDGNAEFPGWSFGLVSATLSTQAAAITTADTLTLSISSAVFGYQDPYGNPSDITLTIGQADLTSGVELVVPDSGSGCNCGPH